MNRNNGCSSNGYSGMGGCQVYQNGVRCGETKTLTIIQEFKQLYEDKMRIIDQEGSGDCSMQAKICLQQDWIRDLTEQNEMLVRAVEELEQEATERVLSLEEKLKQSSKCACETLKILDEKEKKIIELQKELENVSKQTSGFQDSVKDSQIATLKQSMLDMRDALTAEVADKHDTIVMLRRDVQLLEDQCRKADQQTHFKDDIIKELRKDLKQLKTVESSRSRNNLCETETKTSIKADKRCDSNYVCTDKLIENLCSKREELKRNLELDFYPEKFTHPNTCEPSTSKGFPKYSPDDDAFIKCPHCKNKVSCKDNTCDTNIGRKPQSEFYNQRTIEFYDKGSIGSYDDDSFRSWNGRSRGCTCHDKTRDYHNEKIRNCRDEKHRDYDNDRTRDFLNEKIRDSRDDTFRDYFNERSRDFKDDTFRDYFDERSRNYKDDTFRDYFNERSRNYKDDTFRDYFNERSRNYKDDTFRDYFNESSRNYKDDTFRDYFNEKNRNFKDDTFRDYFNEKIKDSKDDKIRDYNNDRTRDLLNEKFIDSNDEKIRDYNRDKTRDLLDEKFRDSYDHKIRDYNRDKTRDFHYEKFRDSYDDKTRNYNRDKTRDEKFKDSYDDKIRDYNRDKPRDYVNDRFRDILSGRNYQPDKKLASVEKKEMKNVSTMTDRITLRIHDVASMTDKSITRNVFINTLEKEIDADEASSSSNEESSSEVEVKVTDIESVQPKAEVISETRKRPVEPADKKQHPPQKKIKVNDIEWTEENEPNNKTLEKAKLTLKQLREEDDEEVKMLETKKQGKIIKQPSKECNERQQRNIASTQGNNNRSRIPVSQRATKSSKRQRYPRVIRRDMLRAGSLGSLEFTMGTNYFCPGFCTYRPFKEKMPRPPFEISMDAFYKHPNYSGRVVIDDDLEDEVFAHPDTSQYVKVNPPSNKDTWSPIPKKYHYRDQDEQDSRGLKYSTDEDARDDKKGNKKLNVPKIQTEEAPPVERRKSVIVHKRSIRRPSDDSDNDDYINKQEKTPSHIRARPVMRQNPVDVPTPMTSGRSKPFLKPQPSVANTPSTSRRRQSLPPTATTPSTTRTNKPQNSSTPHHSKEPNESPKEEPPLKPLRIITEEKDEISSGSDINVAVNVMLQSSGINFKDKQIELEGFNTLETIMRDANYNIIDLIEENYADEQQIVMLNDSIVFYTRVLTQILKDLSGLERRITTINIRDLKEKVTKLEKENEELRIAVKKTTEELECMNRLTQTHATDKKKWEACCQNYENRISCLLKQHNTEKENLKECCRSLEERLARLNEEKIKLMDEFQRCRRHLEETEASYLSECSELKSSLRSSVDTIERLESELGKLNDYNEECICKIRNMQEKIDELSIECCKPPVCCTAVETIPWATSNKSLNTVKCKCMSRKTQVEIDTFTTCVSIETEKCSVADKCCNTPTCVCVSKATQSRFVNFEDDDSCEFRVVKPVPMHFTSESSMNCSDGRLKKVDFTEVTLTELTNLEMEKDDEIEDARRRICELEEELREAWREKEKEVETARCCREQEIINLKEVINSLMKSLDNERQRSENLQKAVDLYLNSISVLQESEEQLKKEISDQKLTISNLQDVLVMTKHSLEEHRQKANQDVGLGWAARWFGSAPNEPNKANVNNSTNNNNKPVHDV